MAKRLFVGIFLGLVIFCTAVYAGSALNIKEGMWEITSQVKMQGMTIPPMTFSQCITKDDLVPQNNSPGQDGCKVSEMKTVGNTVSWTVTCSGQDGDMKGKGKITYHGDRFEGEVTAELSGMVMVTEMSGKRTGPCQ
ncbi:MAG: DUF3617 family protein [Desulfosarcina sp.]|nr:DUF3617 family protein [Desulfosarcina sp.]MBC2743361.1 DUF3617 family protein [Desulfosarcina sp.]MBC2766271.1 DUF3617 family protein [Desulfosarcina sp.]